MVINDELKFKLGYFTSKNGSESLTDLAEALWEYYSNECTVTSGDQLYRNQGAAQLAKWLSELPKRLTHADTTAPTSHF